MYFAVAFCWGQPSRVVGYGSQTSLLVLLGQAAPERPAGIVRFHYRQSAWVPLCEDWSACEQSLYMLERRFFSAPSVKWNSFTCEGVQWRCNVRIVLNQLPVEVGETQKAPQPLGRLRNFPVPDSAQLLWVQTDSYTRFNNKSEVFGSLDPEFTLGNIKVQTRCL